MAVASSWRETVSRTAGATIPGRGGRWAEGGDVGGQHGELPGDGGGVRRVDQVGEGLDVPEALLSGLHGGGHVDQAEV